ncbi:MAG: thermopsin family protease [Nitrososphaerales archaeon]
MTSSQFSAFNASETPLSDSTFYQNGTDSQHSFHVNQGLYWFVFYTILGAANVTFYYDVLPVNPFECGSLNSPQPSGVASFGLFNDSGNLFPYTIQTDEIVGVARVSALYAYNATAMSVDSTVSGTTLQLNSMLVIKQMDGSDQVYWCQNTPDFVTATLNLASSDSIWNASASGLLSNATVTSEGGIGAVHSFYLYGRTQYSYVYESSNSSYSLPLNLAILMKESVSQGEGVLVQMGLQALGRGTGPPAPISWFDNVTIHDLGAQEVYFLVSGNQTTPNGRFYDAELIFGGEGNGESTSFPQMNASLGLFYAGGSSGSFAAFPSYFSFGLDTAEAADNLHVTSSGNGFSQLTVGAPDYTYLGRASGSFDLPTPTTTVSRSTAGLSSGGSSVNYSGVGLVGGIVVALAIVVSVPVVMKRRGSTLDAFPRRDGADDPSGGQTSEVVSNPSPTLLPEEETHACSMCGQVFDEEFLNRCGTCNRIFCLQHVSWNNHHCIGTKNQRLDEQAPERAVPIGSARRFCSSCGQPILIGEKFCSECGKMIELP